jgi:uncharacterized protein YjbI with pentapeptide repeats
VKAELARAWMQGARLAGADLTGADLYGVALHGADLSGVRGLTQAQLDHACGDDRTTLPPGLARPASWPCPEPVEEE